MALLITGGTGYIGSHTVVELLSADQEVVIVDNLSNSSIKVLQRIEQITGKTPVFVESDICDRVAMDVLFSTYNIDSVIHFAGLKAVGESCQNPLATIITTLLERWYCSNLWLSTKFIIWFLALLRPYMANIMRRLLLSLCQPLRLILTDKPS